MSTATRRSGQKSERDSYLELARVWHPRPIRNEAEYEVAAGVVDGLAVRDEETLDAGERDYLDAVTAFIEAYDEKTYPAAAKKRSVAERLVMLVEEAGMTVTGLGKVVGSQPLATMLLKGQREPSKAVIRKLAEHFRVEAGYFL